MEDPKSDSQKDNKNTANAALQNNKDTTSDAPPTLAITKESTEEGDEEDDLYEDLNSPIRKYKKAKRESTGDTITAAATITTTTMDTNTATVATTTTQKPAAAVRSLVQEVDHLQSLVQQLQQDNDILKRNMGTLYRTAVAELQRKDQQVQQLQHDVGVLSRKQGS